MKINTEHRIKADLSLTEAHTIAYYLRDRMAGMDGGDPWRMLNEFCYSLEKEINAHREEKE